MTLRVLVADDHPVFRDGVRFTLERADEIGQVDEAVDGEQAVAMAETGSYDVVVMDVRMPKLDGVSVLQRMGPPPPRVILMTAYALDEQLAQAVEADAFAVVQKPFPVRSLLQLVERAAVPAA